MTAEIATDYSTTCRFGENSVPVSNRRNRFYSNKTGWYFSTREGVDQGPFESRIRAHEANQQYIREHRLQYRKQAWG